jgi:hypothetical protein
MTNSITSAAIMNNAKSVSREEVYAQIKELSGGRLSIVDDRYGILKAVQVCSVAGSIIALIAGVCLTSFGMTGFGNIGTLYGLSGACAGVAIIGMVIYSVARGELERLGKERLTEEDVQGMLTQLPPLPEDSNSEIESEKKD